VDFEEIPKKSQKDFSQFISTSADLHNSNLKLMVALPRGLGVRLCGHGKSRSRVLMNYDQHWRTSAPCPIARKMVLRNIDGS